MHICDNVICLTAETTTNIGARVGVLSHPRTQGGERELFKKPRVWDYFSFGAGETRALVSSLKLECSWHMLCNDWGVRSLIC